MNIGTAIKDYLKEQGIAVSWLADQLGESQQNFGQKIKRDTLDVDFVMQICLVLKQDFFKMLSEDLRLQLAKGEQSISDKYAITYHNLLEENVQLHRELRDKSAPTSATTAVSASKQLRSK